MTNVAKKIVNTLAAIGLGLAVTNVNPVKAAQLNISGGSNIFGAGKTSSPAPGGGTGGQLPPLYNFAAAAGQVLTFSNFSGNVSYSGSPLVSNVSGDGRAFLSGTNISSYGGISGLRNDNAIAFLVGVFLNDSEPTGSGPSPLNFTNNTSFAELSPLLNQTFFIGDGLTGSGLGNIQRFLVPEQATRLFLGFADGFNVQGLPGYYNDNTGSLVANFELQSAAEPVPEPCTILGTLAFAAWGVTNKRKQRKNAGV
ncbi:hypothetical protein [Microcoleus asticus]|uniref:PEP-CTERM sorting domain-containing protein n=1 Tax=Microcoleus asticus IPMA8 TaxID=2563858 RepID=A0ABX2CW02_9CYAN|nr:hypothetical protein [Microcoleus asticus]NQE34298.1 hypothetical protein [Microcoleus asticus IPMA8]